MKNQKLMNVFLYPYNNVEKTLMKNSYQDNFIKNIENHSVKIVNRESKYGILDIFTFFYKTDIFYFNFPENLPDRKFGLVQSIIFPFIFILIKIFRKKVVWILHNKVSHKNKHRTVKLFLMTFMLNFSDKVITLSEEGVEYGKRFIFTGNKIEFFHHPVENNLNKIKRNNKKDIDILIWGLISKYKGVSDFLKFATNSPLIKNYNITIAGKIVGKELKKDILSYQSETVNIIDSFISNKQLENLHSRSKIVLFTYTGKSTLSSAALMFSLSFGSKILGSNYGAFKDLRKIGLIDTYDTFDELIKKSNSNNFNINNLELTNFLDENSWKNFAKNIYQILKQV